jgi:hypothetical protein
MSDKLNIKRWTFYPAVEVTPNGDGTYKIVIDWTAAQETYAWDELGQEIWESESEGVGADVLNAWLRENRFQSNPSQPQILAETFTPRKSTGIES